MDNKEKIGKIIGKFEAFYKDSHMYVSLQSSKLNFSEEEKELINIHPELFFQASKSRIILMVWLCKVLRNTFELYGYSDLDMPNETYEILRTNFKTKAFNRANYISVFSDKSLNILNYSYFTKIEQKSIEEYNKYVSDENKLSLMPHISIKKAEESSSYKKEIKEAFLTKRNADIIIMRSQGKTLDEIGAKLGITRERARQIEFKPKNIIERWLTTREKEILEDFACNKIFDQEKAKKEFGQTYWMVIKYVIMSDNKTGKLNWKYLDSIDLIYYSKTNSIKLDISNIEKALKNQKNSNIIKTFTKEMNLLGYDFWNDDLTEQHFKNSKYNIYNEEIHEGRITIGKSISIVAKNYFKEGIKVTDKKQLKVFADKTNEVFDLGVTAQRAFLTRVQDVLLMCDKGKYVSPDYLKFDNDLMYDITEYVNSMKEKRITYEALYKIFKNDLNLKTSVNNHYYLHGALKYLTEKNELPLTCYRYYVSKPETQKTKSKDFFKTLYDYLKDKPYSLTIEELLKVFPSWNKMYFRYAMMYFPSIVQWVQGSYICLDALDITKEDSEFMFNTVEKLLNNKFGYTTNYQIYNEIKNKRPDILVKLGVDDENKMYHIIQYLMSDKYLCRRPHILKEWKDDNFSTQDLVTLLVKDKEIVNKQELMNDLISYYGNKNSSLSLAIQKELVNYIKISTFEYVRKKDLNINKDDLSKISGLIRENMIKGEVLLPNKITDFSKFPKLKYNWTPWMLCEIVEEYNLDFKIIGKRTIPSQNTMTIVLKSNSKLSNKSDVFNWLLNNDYKGDFTKPDLFQYAKTIGIFHTNLTSDDIDKYMV